MKQTILCVDDEPVQRRLLANFLRKHDYQVFEAASGEDALKELALHPCNLVLSDMKMGKMSGKDLFLKLQEHSQNQPFILITAFGNIDQAVEMIQLGVADYISKPVNLNELHMKIERIFEQDHLKKENENLRNELLHLQTGTQILTRNRDMLLILEKVAKLAKTDVPLLILGESGTGKELVARSLHEFSTHRKGPFIPVNCAALNPGVLESELFGHERGAFTGASASKTGRIEMANDGTLFLDEIGDVPLEIQVKLLRVLQEQEIERVGGTRRIPVNFRLVTATHRNLEQAISEERFREDFYYRINVVSVHLPPLRDRPEDIPLLVKYFSEQFARRYHIEFEGIAPEAMEQMQKYSFPGNIRELMNIVQRNLVLSGTGMLRQFDLPHSDRPVSSRQWLQDMPDLPLPEALEQVEKELIQRALNLASGVQTKAAEILGITERNLRYKLKK